MFLANKELEFQHESWDSKEERTKFIKQKPVQAFRQPLKSDVLLHPIH